MMRWVGDDVMSNDRKARIGLFGGLFEWRCCRCEMRGVGGGGAVM